VFSHVFVSVGDFEAAVGFHSAIMDILGHECRFCDTSKPWAGWHSNDGARPFFVICHAFNGELHSPGNGQMLAFEAQSRDQVRRCHQKALELGGKCEGPPGLRPHYHENYYGAYFRDPDGNKFCVVCHYPE